MIGIYLGAFTAFHPGYNLIYQDINGKRDLGGDMMDVDLNNMDYVIATPPCNYYSRANWRRDSSIYSLQTKHLLPGILDKLSKQKKPFIVENVRNKKMFKSLGLFDIPGIYVYFVGRHTYWSNIKLDLNGVIQKPIVEIRDGKRIWLSSQHLPRSKRQGGQEVHEVIDIFLKTIHSDIFRSLIHE